MKRYCEKIEPLDREAMEQAGKRLDSLAKPIGSLNELEKIATVLCGIFKTTDVKIRKKAVAVFAADNGIFEEGISPVPQAVTAVQTVNMTKGITGINVLSNHAGADVYLVDVGINSEDDIPGVINKKVMKGTQNMAKGPAMSREQAEQALQVGFDMAVSLAKEGYDLLAPGEMGICNTSSSAAVLSGLTGTDVRSVTGMGVGLNQEMYEKKVQAVQQALEINRPNREDPVEVLSKVGGLDIAAMAGFYLGAAHMRRPVVVDGFISIVAALVACRIAPETRSYLFGSHQSMEKGYEIARKELGIHPLLNLHLRLGEGSGCPMAFFIIEAAAKILTEMGTLEQGNIDSEDLVDIRE